MVTSFRARMIRPAVGLCFLVGLALTPTSTRGQWREDFESLQTSWRLADRDCRIQVFHHQRSRQAAHSGHSAELLDVSMGRGTYVRLAHPITPSRVFAELEPSVWIKANRAGIRFHARVVLPHARDPRSGEPLSTLLDGTVYQEAGTWQQLWIEDAKVQLSRKIPILRSQFAGLTDVDDREAYIDMIVLNTYTGPGRLQMFIDDLLIERMVPAVTVPERSTAGTLISTGTNSAAVSSDNRSNPLQPSPSWTAGRDVAGPGVPASPGLRVQGELLMHEDRPVFVRAIEHNGEPLEFLRNLGFNAVVMGTPPTSLQLQEAARLNLWLVAPPPDRPTNTFRSERIVAWHLGQTRGAGDLESTRRLVDRIRSLDPHHRPIVTAPTDSYWQYSRISEILLIKQEPLGTSFPLSRYPDWLQERAALARLGTPTWAAVQTEPPRATLDQLQRLGFPAADTACLEPDQMRIVAFGAVASGVRGLVFRSEHSLADPALIHKLRAKSLERLNLELQLIEPWLAGGDRHRSVDSSNPHFRARVIDTDHAQLVIAFPEELHQQFSLGPADDAECSLVLDSLSSSPDGYDLSYGGLVPFRPKRVPGGVLVTWKPRDRVSLMVLTASPLVLNHLGRQIGEYGKRATELRLETNTAWLQVVSDTHRRLAGAGHPDPQVDQLLITARQLLSQSQRLLTAGDLPAAHQFSHQAATRIARAQQVHWNRAWRAFPDPISSPCCTHFTTIPFHWELASRLQRARWSQNVLPAGDLESLEHAVRSGWQRTQQNPANVESLIEFSLEQPHGGRSCLRLAAWPVDPEQEPAALDRPVVRIDTAPVPVRAGQLLRMHGWVRIPNRLRATHQGLVIKDSSTGKALAHRMVETDSWTDFTLYRVATRDEPLRLSFELAGLGEVWLDDISVELIDLPQNRQGAAQHWEQLR